ncbi:chitin-binding domain-containing protein [Tropicibacter alexandrii]|uniref:chitin-binding domain-containing protein n=1 Tax=Tropicibacter alexandrii TaxID=2267683 RepID=UPI001008EE3B|nr:chitin-binding domain-containing protein [Tropicibacter alexandrii]
MTLKTLIVGTVLAFAPALAFASCAGHEKQVMSCTDGSVYDAETNTCTVVSG